MDSNALAALADELACDVASLLAVAEVESAGGGFLPDGRPKILFEAHIFSARTGRRFDVSHPTLSTRTWRRDLYRGGIAEWERLRQARELAGDVAFEACSWGAFQVMGFNYRSCGHASVAALVAAMATDTGQVTSFARFLEAHPPMLRALRAKDWRSFARLYNGPGQVTAYAARIGDAYARLKGMPIANGFPLTDRTVPAKGLRRSKSIAVGGLGIAAGAGAMADQLDPIVSAVATTRTAISSAVDVMDVLEVLIGGPALPWFLAMVAMGALVFVLWRYAGKIRSGDVIVR